MHSRSGSQQRASRVSSNPAVRAPDGQDKFSPARKARRRAQAELDRILREAWETEVNIPAGKALAAHRKKQRRELAALAAQPPDRARVRASIGAVKRSSPLVWGLLHPEAVEPWITRGFIGRVEEKAEKSLLGVEGAAVRIGLDRKALAGYVPSSDECVDPIAAVWLYEARAQWLVCSATTWCLVCGAVCTDGHFTPSRLERLSEAGQEGARPADKSQPLRRWCDACGAKSKRYRPGLRWCAFEDCARYFWTTRANQIYCHETTCGKRQGDLDRKRARS